MAALDDHETNEGLKLVRLLLRRVTRGFYAAKHSILLEIVLRHSAIRDDYLAQMMGLQNQEVRKLCGRMKEDRLLTMQTRLEPKEGQSRPINRTYYYIDYRDAVDAIKYRIHRLVRTIEDQSKNDFDSKGYVCPYCQRRYGALDVLSLVSIDGQSFRCIDCSTVLVDDEDSMESKVSQERLGRLQRQTTRLVEALKEIDASFVPDNDFISALSRSLPPTLDSSYSTYTHDISLQKHNESHLTTSTIGLKIDFNGGEEDAVQSASRKATQALMNQLPEWHLNSTISGEAISRQLTRDGDQQDPDPRNMVKLDAVATDEVAQYYKSLRAQQADESDDSMDEDDYEELPVESKAASIATDKAEIDNQGGDAEESDDEFEDV